MPCKLAVLNRSEFSAEQGSLQDKGENHRLIFLKWLLNIIIQIYFTTFLVGEMWGRVGCVFFVCLLTSEGWGTSVESEELKIMNTDRC